MRREFGRPPWERVLYRRQPYSDNYTDARFFPARPADHDVHLGRNDLIVRSAPVVYQVSLAWLFVTVFVLVERSMIRATDILSMCAAVGTSAAFALRKRLGGSESRWLSAVQSSVIIILFTYLTSPIIKTLTRTVSDGSIWIMTGSFLGLHVATFPFWRNQGSTFFHSSWSLNTALFASALLSSRLASAVDVFAFVLFSLVTFGLLPVLGYHRWLNIASVTVCGLLSWSWSAIALGVYVGMIGVVGLLAPVALAHKLAKRTMQTAAGQART